MCWLGQLYPAIKYYVRLDCLSNALHFIFCYQCKIVFPSGGSYPHIINVNPKGSNEMSFCFCVFIWEWVISQNRSKDFSVLIPRMNRNAERMM